MPSDPLVQGLFRALVLRIGGQEAATAFLAARWGAASGGHVSRMCAGSVGVTIEAAMALEDAIGEYPVTQYLALRAANGALPMTGANIMEMTAHAALAGGQAQLALARALDCQGPGGLTITPQEAGEIGAAASNLRAVADALLAATERAARGAGTAHPVMVVRG